VSRRTPLHRTAAVVGVPDADKGELVKALIVPRSDGTVYVAKLEDHCRQHLSKHKRPRVIEIVRELRLLSNGC
jgi:long-chain acyl-CoA synthetase